MTWLALQFAFVTRTFCFDAGCFDNPYHKSHSITLQVHARVNFPENHPFGKIMERYGFGA